MKDMIIVEMLSDIALMIHLILIDLQHKVCGEHLLEFSINSKNTYI